MINIPKGWYVAEAGQNHLHMLWFAVVVNFDDVANNVEEPRHFVAEECDSFEEAIGALNDNLVDGISYLPQELRGDIATPKTYNFHNVNSNTLQFLL